MRTLEFPELETVHFSMEPDVAEVHLAEITTALGAAEPVTPGSSHSGRWRRWVASLAVAGAALVPAAAVASDDALPGDALYSVKLRLEPLVRLLDDEVVARHRIEELEAITVVATDEPTVDRLISDARAALAELDAPELVARLDSVTDRRAAEQTGRGQPDDRGLTDEGAPSESDAPQETTPPTVPRQDQSDDGPPARPDTTTTTSPGRGQDRGDDAGANEATTTTTSTSAAGDQTGTSEPANDRRGDRP